MKIERKKIAEELIPLAYETSKKVYEKKLTVTEGVKVLVDAEMNKNSASDYIYNFRYLMQGRKFTRALNAPSMNYFLENIHKDYGIAHLTDAVSALIQHIEYFEAAQKKKTTLHEMRSIHQRYMELLNVPSLITNINQLTQNIETIENYLTEGNETERVEAFKLIKQGICFVAYVVEQEMRFAPSRFLGYQNNKLFKYSTKDVDGRDTNKAINALLKSKPVENNNLEQKYIDYCIKLGIKPQPNGGAYAVDRKYWSINLDNDFSNNNTLNGEFPEGKIVERTHKARERNSQVVEIAKQNFKAIHGKLFCQVCLFDFEKTYGSIGENFIEGHHTIAVSDMLPEHKTKPGDIAMLCGNCHRMVHIKRPWLSMEELSKLLK